MKRRDGALHFAFSLIVQARGQAPRGECKGRWAGQRRPSCSGCVSEIKGAGKVCSPAFRPRNRKRDHGLCAGAHILKLADPFGRLKPGLHTSLGARVVRPARSVGLEFAQFAESFHGASQRTKFLRPSRLPPPHPKFLRTFLRIFFVSDVSYIYVCERRNGCRLT